MRTQRGAILILLGLLAGPVLSASKAGDKTSKKIKEEPPPKLSKEAKERMAKAAAPGPQHKILDGLVGSWTESTRWWMTPKDKPEPTKGSSEIKWILGGRFLEQKFSGSARGQKMEGLGLIGYDTLGEKFVSSWYDTGSTAVGVSVGTYDAATQTINAAGSALDPATNEQKIFRTALHLIDANTHVYEMYLLEPNGLEIRALEIVSTRKKL